MLRQNLKLCYNIGGLFHTNITQALEYFKGGWHICGGKSSIILSMGQPLHTLWTIHMICPLIKNALFNEVVGPHALRLSSSLMEPTLDMKLCACNCHFEPLFIIFIGHSLIS